MKPESQGLEQWWKTPIEQGRIFEESGLEKSIARSSKLEPLPAGIEETLSPMLAILLKMKSSPISPGFIVDLEEMVTTTDHHSWRMRPPPFRLFESM